NVNCYIPVQVLVLTSLLALASAHPSYDARSNSVHIPILKDDRIQPDASGVYSFDVETGDGIYRTENGAPLYSAEGAVGQQGAVSFTFPSGEPFDLKFVADENGYQPQSAWIPVAPEFPHPIPQFVLDQIEKARIEDSQGQRYDAPAPSNRYS
ncbi:UNVERIFIED_CONTAM: hypothetical protein GTU68_045712, partial [Idotea baltica]|nr:hypothetical protein [Idotea baltica]